MVALLFAAVWALSCLASTGHGYPAFYMQAIPRRTQQLHFVVSPAAQHPRHAAQKRAFDRLDMSPFDFDAMTKRFNDDELSAMPVGFLGEKNEFDCFIWFQFDDFYVPALQVRKRAFDRLEDSGFFGLQKRAFDRLDNSFMLMKRAEERNWKRKKIGWTFANKTRPRVNQPTKERPSFPPASHHQSHAWTTMFKWYSQIIKIQNIAHKYIVHRIKSVN
jgi:hypothetical protein